MPRDSSSSRASVWRYGPALLAVGLPLLAYLLTVYPGVGDRQGTGDAIEYQLVGRLLSIPHEPGYPQYVLLSHLWSYVPLPVTLATKINLLSAVFTTVAGLFFFAAAKRLSDTDFAAVIATWMVLLTPSVWLLSTQAEVYTLHLMWVSAVVWAALAWSETQKPGLLVTLFFFYALSFGNHLTMITLLPALIFLILAQDPRVALRWRTWAWATLAIALGLLQYALLLWRSYNPHPALLPRFPLEASLGELLEYITGSRFVDRHFLKTGVEGWLPRVWDAVVFSLDQLTLPFAVLCGFGLVLSFRQARRRTFFLVIGAASVVAFAAAYGIKDSSLYIMPAWICTGLLGAIGLSRALEIGTRWRRQIEIAIVLLLVVLIAGRGARMRVVDNPTDLATVIDVAAPNTGILVAFKQRRARLLSLYYQYAQITDKAQHLAFHSVNNVLATGLEDVRDQPLYFRDPGTANFLDRSEIDFRRVDHPGKVPSIYVTRPDQPLVAIELRPLWDGTVAVTLRDQSMDLLGDSQLHLFLFSSRQARSKGYLVIDTESHPNWSQGLQNALDVASPSDRFLLVTLRLDERTRSNLEEILGRQSIALRAIPEAQRHTVAWWKVGGQPEDVLLQTDLTSKLILELEPPVGEPN